MLRNEDLDKAFTIYEEWGPRRAIPRAERLKQEYPSLSDNGIEILIQEIKSVSRAIWKIAGMGGEAKLPRKNMTELLQEKHPYLTSEGLLHALVLINYHAWHEGYDR